MQAQQWLRVCVALVCLLAATTVWARNGKINILIPERDVDWPWKPQLDAQLPDAFFTGEAPAMTEGDQWRVLAYVGAPFRIKADSSHDLMQLLELVTFMRADDEGRCPHYTTPYRVHYYTFHYAELELLYGEARWAALQRLQEPKAWSLVLTEAVGPAVRAAESLISRMKTSDLPGVLLVKLQDKHHPSGSSEMRVPLGDFRVVARVLLPGHQLEHKIPQLTVDSDARERRRHLHYFVQSKGAFTARVAKFDAATVLAQMQLRNSLIALQKAEQDAYDVNAGFKLRYQRFLRERQRRAALTGSSSSSGEGATSDVDPRASWVSVRKAAPQVQRTPEARQAVACQKVGAAWRTLQRNGLQWEDGRATQLLRLHARHSCSLTLPPFSREQQQQETTTTWEETEKAWRIAVAEMMAQRATSGRSPTFAQLFAVLFGVWEVAMRKEGAAADFTPITDFVRFVERFVESGEAVAMAGGRLPRYIRAELHYLVGILHLVSLKASSSTTSSTLSVSSTVRGLLHLHESLSSGSHHAAGTLATLREHGLFTRQHTKAAMQLLLRSMRAAPSHLLRQLLLTPSTETATATPSSTNVSHITEQRYSNRDPSRLLRFEQFYAVDHTLQEVDDPFMTRSSVRTMVAVTHENIQSTDDAPELEDVYREAAVARGEDRDYAGSITVRLSRRVLKANVLFSGFKDTPRNAQEAQCELLVVLRQLGYFCDLDLRSLLPAGGGGLGAARRLRTAVGLPFPDACPEHATEVFRVVGNPQHTLLTCPGANGDSTFLPTHNPPHLSVPTSQTLHSMLHMTLLSLSYVHLLHTRNYELSHMYAALSLEMSMRLQRLLLKRLGQVRQFGQQLKAAADDDSFVTTSAAAAADAANRTDTMMSHYSAIWALSEGSDEVAFAAEMLVDDIERATGSAEEATATSAKGKKALSPDALAQRAVERCRSVADSPFVYTEALLLLGLSRWAKGGPLVAGTLSSEDVEQRLSQWTVEPFQLLARLVNTGLATAQTRREEEEDLTVLKHPSGTKRRAAVATSANSTHSPPPQLPLDAHALFLVCLAAMKRWKRDFPLVHLLDSASYSVRRTDPFVLASFLLHARDPTTDAPLLSIEKVRALAHAASPHLLGNTPHFLPSVDDTVETYAARLLRFAMRRLHSLEPSVELLRSGSYAVGRETVPAGVERRRRDVLDDAPPRRFRLRVLRRVKQQTLETADLQPLLYAADVHEYLNASRWTYMGTALNAAYNALLYPFTATTSESVLAAMSTRLQFIEPSERKRALQTFPREEVEKREGATEEAGAQEAEESSADGGASEEVGSDSSSSSPDVAQAPGKAAHEETTSVSSFVSAFADEPRLREHFIACQLLSFTLESGMPEGFSLLFHEATDRGNPYARLIADVLADSVFGRWAVSVWTEHHVTAQWQREKGGIPNEGTFFSLNTRTPFRYASLEGRQELFARLSRWKASRALASVAASTTAVAARATKEALDQLLWCSGLLTRRAFYDTGRVHLMAYEGAMFPAADLACVAELSTLLGDTRLRVQWSKAEARQAQVNVTDLLRDLSDRLAYDYDLIESPPPRRLPPSESEYHRNLSHSKTGVPSSDLQHSPRRRFTQSSTQLVEPWNRRTRQINSETLDYGEGSYYNSRLHRVSGHRWGATLRSWWLWLRHLFP